MNNLLGSKVPRFTNSSLNKNNVLSSGWSHNSNHFRFPRTLSEAGIKWDPHYKPRKSWYEVVMLLVSAFIISFILAGVTLYGV